MVPPLLTLNEDCKNACKWFGICCGTYDDLYNFSVHGLSNKANYQTLKAAMSMSSIKHKHNVDIYVAINHIIDSSTVLA